MESSQLSFSSNHQLKKKYKKDKVEFPQHNSIYTTPYFINPSKVPTNHSVNSRLSLDSNPERYNNYFINPKPVRPVPRLEFHKDSHPGNHSRARLLMNSPEYSSKVAEMAQKVEMLRRTVSQKKIASENRINDMVIRSQRLKERYIEQDRRLEQVVTAINHHFT